MKILTSEQYNAICDIVMDQKREIERLTKENEDLRLERIRISSRLNNTESKLCSLIRFVSSCKTTSVLDFPNSKKGGGPDIGNIDINDIFNH